MANGKEKQIYRFFSSRDRQPIVCLRNWIDAPHSAKSVPLIKNREFPSKTVYFKHVLYRFISFALIKWEDIKNSLKKCKLKNLWKRSDKDRI